MSSMHFVCLNSILLWHIRLLCVVQDGRLKIYQYAASQQHLLPGTTSGFCFKEIVKKKGYFQSVNFCYANRSKNNVAHSFVKKTHLDFR
jgi:hypothetical protein